MSESAIYSAFTRKQAHIENAHTKNHKFSHTPSFNKKHITYTMTVDTITNEFGDVNIRLMTNNIDETPLKNKVSASANPVSPESDSPSVSSSDEPTTSIIRRETVTVSEHKLAELAGQHAVEPLLKENPNRFVLFPIEDNDVSII